MEIRTVGVEEELILVDPRTRLAAPRSDDVVGHNDDRIDRVARVGRSRRATDDLSQELLLHQVETMTEPTTQRDRLRRQIVSARRTAGTSASQHDLAVIASGTVPLAGPQRRVTPDDRYQELIARFGDLARAAGTCGMHVHVRIADDDEGVAVIDRVGSWLPFLLALSANSPYAEGQDTGYASWRAQVWSRWPTAGATQEFGSAERYHEVVQRLIEIGAARDVGNVYFDVRLADEQPTVELRIADVCTDVDDALLVAVLGRALVDTAARQAREGRPPVTTRVEDKRAVAWRASRYAREGGLVRPGTTESLTWDQATTLLLEELGESLEATDDLDWTRERLSDRSPRGAALQRLAYERSGEVEAVVDDLVARTTASWDDQPAG